MKKEQALAAAAMQRRAILFSDLVESVRLYERFEARTIEQWRRFAALARDSIAPAHGGRLVRTVGDGLLLEFETAAGATAAAFALHQALKAFNGPDAGEAALWLRSGIHWADVLAEDDDLFGSGVNLAARLASVAQPGQIAASVELRSALTDSLHARIEDLGMRYMKHLCEPVRVFLLHAPGQAAGPRAPSSADLRPAIAVVPFVALPADVEHDALGHAMADDIIASLTSHPGLRVLSRASTAALRGTTLAPARLRELLGASFLLTGQFYVRGDRVSLAAELCELQGSQVLWAGRVGGDITALFEGQDDLVPHLVAQVSQQVMAFELARVRSLPMDSLASYSLMLGATGLLHSLLRHEFARSREVLEHLADRHPRQAAPNALLTEWHVVQYSQGWSEDAKRTAQEASVNAQQALDKDPEQPAAQVAAGAALVIFKRDYGQAMPHYQRALTLNPHHAEAWARLSECQSESGLHDQSLESALRAIALSPLDSRRFIYECSAARSAYMMGRFDLTELHARASVRMNALHAPAHRHLVAALWRLGEHDAARQAASNYLKLLPGATVGRTAGSDKVVPTPTSFSTILKLAGIPA
ncbi:MAG: adenylate/guanylate cyclase domain-containing protein [Rubrivivax sp.]|nr:adenylate/guanylate cyclase domain-containing protein [Rubrivivax sp.]MDP3614988.1 adenylate/guanylate cyclase domain-containing protein [Rubrivivax sp.]